LASQLRRHAGPSAFHCAAMTDQGFTRLEAPSSRSLRHPDENRDLAFTAEGTAMPLSISPSQVAVPVAILIVIEMTEFFA
jgi:hypothetical protein